MGESEADGMDGRGGWKERMEGADETDAMDYRCSEYLLV